MQHFARQIKARAALCGRWQRMGLDIIFGDVKPASHMGSARAVASAEAPGHPRAAGASARLSAYEETAPAPGSVAARVYSGAVDARPVGVLCDRYKDASDDQWHASLFLLCSPLIRTRSSGNIPERRASAQSVPASRPARLGSKGVWRIASGAAARRSAILAGRRSSR